MNFTPRRSLFILSLFLISGCRVKDPVLARVGGSVIRTSSFQEEIAGVPFSSQSYLRTPSGRRELLDLLIRRKVILLSALDAPMTSDLANRLAELNDSFETQQQTLIKKYKEEQERLRVAYHMASIKKSQLASTDEEIRAFWDRENEVRAAHILVSDRTLAESLRKKIADGEKFEDLAKRHSEDTSTGKIGGDLGFLLRGSLVPEFENVLFSLKTGEISGPVQSPYGLHLIRRTADRRLSTSPLDDALKTRIKAAIDSQKFQNWFDQTKPHYAVSVDVDALNDVVLSTGLASNR